MATWFKYGPLVHWNQDLQRQMVGPERGWRTKIGVSLVPPPPVRSPFLAPITSFYERCTTGPRSQPTAASNKQQLLVKKLR